MTSEFVKARDAIEHWVTHLWHTQGVKDTVQVTEDAALAIGRQALTAGALAGMSAHAAGGDHAAVEKATMDAVVHTGQTVGLSVGAETVAKIVSTVASAIQAPVQTAPEPPAS